MSTLRELQTLCHKRSVEAGWYTDLKTGLKITPTLEIRAMKLCLIHSEISEALEGARKNLMDDHLPHRKMEEVELVDAIIRILDYADYMGYDLQTTAEEKMEYNLHREDHKIENRLLAGGKQV